ncbi:hypothetical protein [Tepidibacter aestuarii]|uniref:hypothetical protein n=1 Tax=Tepidibacter aestuarii TaxID=2925782 RepID=UPI0020C13F2C|nr:hypothetical protein [Tepidibacter aestuarii]CAH2214310.1 protein of unknown function [Tepidibacter aestuarii]
MGCNSCCELIKTRKVICDETVFGRITKQGVDIGYILSDSARIDRNSSTVNVTAKCCRVEVVSGKFIAYIDIFAQEEIVIRNQGGSPQIINLEYGFCEEVPFIFQKCTPAGGCFDDLDDLECQILDIEATTYIDLNDDCTLDQCIIIKVKMKIEKCVQMFVTLCPPEQTGDSLIVTDVTLDSTNPCPICPTPSEG